MFGLTLSDAAAQGGRVAASDPFCAGDLQGRVVIRHVPRWWGAVRRIRLPNRSR